VQLCRCTSIRRSSKPTSLRARSTTTMESAAPASSFGDGLDRSTKHIPMKVRSSSRSTASRTSSSIAPAMPVRMLSSCDHGSGYCRSAKAGPSTVTDFEPGGRQYSAVSPPGSCSPRGMGSPAGCAGNRARFPALECARKNLSRVGQSTWPPVYRSCAAVRTLFARLARSYCCHISCHII
jgi:hypothetical protein